MKNQTVRVNESKILELIKKKTKYVHILWDFSIIFVRYFMFLLKFHIFVGIWELLFGLKPSQNILTYIRGIRLQYLEQIL